MKIVIYFLSSILLLYSCESGTCNDGIMNQEEADVDCGGPCNACDIVYGDPGAFGSNILHGNDSMHLFVGHYSFQAEMKEGSSLKVQLEKLSGDVWFYMPSSNNGWSVSSYNDGYQTFTLLNPGTYDLQFELMYSPDPNITDGSFYIHYYENGEAITKTKYVYWN